MRRCVSVFLLISLMIFSSITPVCNASDLRVLNDYNGAERAVLSAWDNLENSLDIREFCIKEENFIDFCDYVTYRNTEYFYVSISRTCTVDGLTGEILIVNFEYSIPKSEIPERISIFNNKCDGILGLMPKGIKNEEKLLFLHDYIASNTAYEVKVFNNSSYDDGYIRTAYGCIVNETAVCEGISEAFLYFCKRLGIECYIVSSSVMHHEWNMVKLGEYYYHIDITQDAPVYNLGKYGFHQPYGDVTHKFFLKSDSEIRDGALGNSVHHDWTAPYSATDSTTFKNAFWNNASGLTNYKNGKYYFISGADLVEYDYNSDTTTVFYNISDEIWDCSCSIIHKCKGEYSKAVVDDTENFVYFPSGNNVYSYNLDNGAISVIYSRSGKGFIYSLMFKNNKIIISIRDDEKGTNFDNDRSNVNPFYIDLSFSFLKPEKELLTGDSDEDGKISIADVLMLKKYHLKITNELNYDTSDINGDKSVDMKDILFLRKIITNRQG